jgi:hypothetical protein
MLKAAGIADSRFESPDSSLVIYAQKAQVDIFVDPASLALMNMHGFVSGDNFEFEPELQGKAASAFRELLLGRSVLSSVIKV